MIDARVNIVTDPAPFTHPVMLGEIVDVLDEDAFQDAQHADLLTAGRTLGRDVVRLEVFYPTTSEADFDAVEIDYRSDPPTVTTLPSYAEVTP